MVPAVCACLIEASGDTVHGATEHQAPQGHQATQRPTVDDIDPAGPHTCYTTLGLQHIRSSRIDSTPPDLAACKTIIFMAFVG